MNAYIITYDLIGETDYDSINKKIDALYVNSCHILGSTWIIVTSRTIDIVCEELSEFMEGDKVFVAEIAQSNIRDTYLSLNLKPSDKSWIKKHL